MIAPPTKIGPRPFCPIRPDSRSSTAIKTNMTNAYK